MLIEHVITAFVVLLLLALVARPISKLIRLPYTSVLVVTGFVASEIIVFAGLDTGIRADNYQALIFYVFIPVLVFEAGYKIDKQQLLENIFPILFLAIVGMLLTCVLTAVLLFYGIGHESGFPWIAALLCAALLAATDPVAVVAKLKEVNAPERLSVLLEGESLFNDATAIVLFGLFLSMALMPAEQLNVSNAVLGFATVFLGGVVCGSIIGYVAGLIQRFTDALTYGLLTLVVAYGSYLLAEFLHVSGVMSTLMASVVMSSLAQKYDTDFNMSVSNHLWDVVGHVANTIVFLVMGVVITVSMFEERWLAMLIAVVAVLVARALSVYGGLLLIRPLQTTPVGSRYQAVITWGGLRGAITLALALSLPTSLDYWWTIQSIAFGVVLFTLFVQAPTIRPLLNRLKIDS